MYSPLDYIFKLFNDDFTLEQIQGGHIFKNPVYLYTISII
jgi:hypothetical protein